MLGALGHAQLLAQQPELSKESRERLPRIREHCRNIAEHGDALTHLCTLD